MNATGNTNQLFSLNKQIALVSGACRGLGYQIAHGLANAGATVIVHARDEQRAKDTAHAFNNMGLSASWLSFDITDNHARKEAFEQIEEQYGRLDILINNASIRIRKTLQDLTPVEIEHIVHTNILSNISLSRSAINLMRKNRYGRIVTISSIAGHVIRNGDFIYPITKQALNTMTRSIAVEYGSEGILCNAVAPGIFDTEHNEALVREPDVMRKIQERNPLQRLGKPDEIIGPVLFLTSPAASYINGQVLTVDGGLSIAF
ncbi:MAG: SDR family oxidoreductase [Alcaligenaceae bacterium]|nr:SDR family oxidoreductase [Alcaligenaceae bacterium]